MDSVRPGYTRIEGSLRLAATGSRRIGGADSKESLSVTLYVRRRPDAAPLLDHDHWVKIPPGKRTFLSRPEFAAQYGAAQADLDRVADHAKSKGLTIQGTDIARRTVRIAGTAQQMNDFFAVDLGHYESTVGIYRDFEGHVHVPSEIGDLVQAVFGLDTRPLTEPHNVPNGTAVLTPPWVAELYQFPATSAAGQTIAILEFGGGYNPSDIAAYFSGTSSPLAAANTAKPFSLTAPTITDVNVGNRSNNPSQSDQGASAEVTLDIIVASSVAQGAHIVVYFANQSGGSSTAQDWADVINAAIHDATNAPSVISISWSHGVENDWTSSQLQTISDAFQSAAMMGVTVFVASGDFGSDAHRTSSGVAQLKYPGSDPWVTSCGGTVISNVNASTNSFDESTWNDGTPGGASGGGVSEFFPLPSWQANAGIPPSANPQSVLMNQPLGTAPGRGVPDIAGNASLFSGYATVFFGSNPFPLPIASNGFAEANGGTSVVSPLYAGLIAILNASLGAPIGFLNPTLYALNGTTVFRDVNDGVNNADPYSTVSAPTYLSGPGWDACTGLGSLNGTELLNALAPNYPPRQRLYFVLDKSTFGRDEVTDNLLWPSAFWLILEGFTPSQVGAAVPSRSGTFAAIPGVSVGDPVTGAPSGIAYDVGNTGANANVVQRIRFGYDVRFTGGTGAGSSITAFPTTAPAVTPKSLTASINFTGNALTAPQAEIELAAGEDPYFSSVDPATGNYFYLSRDIRVFTATPGPNLAAPPVPGGPRFMQDNIAGAYQYIGDLVGYLNQNYGYQNANYTPIDSPDPLDSVLPGQSGALRGDSSVTPTTTVGSTPYNNYNFAIARVRLKGTPGIQAQNVKVFFRLFTTQTNDTDFIDSASVSSLSDPSITFPSMDSMPGVNDPISPLPGTDAGGHVNGSTLPFFATANQAGNPTDYNANGVNNQTITVPSNQTQGYVWAFFGCFLNVYDPQNVIASFTAQQWLAGGTHHCIVAQIAYKDAPIVNAGGVIANPDNNDKLTQRNLEVTPSGNPGYPATHRVPQTFDVRPSPLAARSNLTLADYPDELMIDWGSIPAGAIANIFWPEVGADAVVKLAKQLYRRSVFSAADAHTIQCVVTGGVTYVPIPTGGAQSYAGLLSVTMPDSVRTKEHYKVQVRRVTTRRPTGGSGSAQEGRRIVSDPGAGGISAGSVKRKAAPTWRYIVGTFLIDIPVERESAILPEDEHLLGVLKWRLGIIPRSNRWYPVLRRYVDLVSARVNGMGGRAESVVPISGYYPARHDHLAQGPSSRRPAHG